MLHPAYAASRSWMVPGADDIVFNHQSTSHHDADHVRQVRGRRINVLRIG